MKYSFTCIGNKNITSKHKNTLEFTKDSKVSLKGDCIVGVKADFSLKKLKKYIKSVKNNKKIIIVIETMNNNIGERINAQINPSFNSDKEMVIRKSDFISDRTFAIKADKAAVDLNRELIDTLTNNKKKFRVILD